MKQLTARQAIDKLQNAIAIRDKKQILDLTDPDDRDLLPDWDEEPNHIWEEWSYLLEQTDEILGI